ANGDFKFVELVHGSPLACRIKSFPIRLPRGESGSRTLCHCSSCRTDGAAFEPEVGSLRLPGSRESRYHFSQRTVPPTIRIIIPDHAHVYADTLLEKACDPWRRREGRLLVTRPGLERRVPMTLDDRRQCRVPPLRPSGSGRRAARRSAGGKPGAGGSPRPKPIGPSSSPGRLRVGSSRCGGRPLCASGETLHAAAPLPGDRPKRLSGHSRTRR